MGCSCSKTTKGRLQRSKGGSMIMGKRNHPEEEDHFEKTSEVMTPETNTYKMGARIMRPVDLDSSFKVDIATTAKNNTPGVKVIGAYKSYRGRSAMPPHKPNQDSVAVFQLKKQPDVAVFTVFDGHGPYGEYASHFCRMEMHPAMLAAPSLKYDMKKTMTETLKRVHEKFNKVSPSTGVDPLVSGTTCISVAFQGNKIYCANVGDSRAIIGMKRADGTTQVVPISDDHKPQRPDEKARIKKSSAILMTERDVRGLEGPNPSDKVYICREKNGDIIYGVLFTRSLGDKDAHEHLGVSADPEFREATVTLETQFVVLASDGVWDHMTNEEVLDICVAKDEPLLSCAQIVRTAAERWENNDLDHRRDDITVMVLKVNPDGSVQGGSS